MSSKSETSHSDVSGMSYWCSGSTRPFQGFSRGSNPRCDSSNNYSYGPMENIMNEPKIIFNEPKNLNAQALEEFFNRCHDEDGKFCPTDGVVSGKFKEDTLHKETSVDTAKRYAEAFVGIPNQSSLKAQKFSKISLRSYSAVELQRFRTQFRTDVKNLKAARTTALFGLIQIPISIDIINRAPLAVFSASRSAVVLGFVEWRSHQIRSQIRRIDMALAKRKERNSTFDLEEFQTDSYTNQSLIEEILKAQKLIDEGKLEKVGRPTKADLLSVKEYADSLKVDPEDGITEDIINSLKFVVQTVMKDSPQIILSDPRNANSPRKISLAARVEAVVELEEFARFEEKLHPRLSDGKFSRRPVSAEGTSLGPSADIREKLHVNGDQGFKDVLVGLAAGAINEVHSVPANLQSLNITQLTLKAKTDDMILMGQYRVGTNKLDIDPRSSTESALTLIHEMGHFFDFNWKEKNGRFGDLSFNGALLVALKNSAAYKKVDDILKTRTDLTKNQRDFGEYLQDTRELFARAYTQYIVSRCSNETLKKEFNTVRQNSGTYHWEDKDFEPIGRVFDNIFKTKPKPAPKKKKK